MWELGIAGMGELINAQNIIPSQERHAFEANAIWDWPADRQRTLFVVVPEYIFINS